MDELLKQTVVVDVESLYVYVGDLANVNDKTVTLENADVHDLRDSKTTRERYVLDVRRDGVHANRTRVLIQRRQIVSISALRDVVE